MIVAVKWVDPEPVVEVHCHGGRRVVRWLVEQLEAACGFAATVPAKPQAARLLPFAPTLRTASILLDQLHGAFDRAVAGILANPDQAAEPLAALARYAPVGRHLVAPWKVVIAGPPNVGKSSLVNALAGYQRTVVSDVPGTTRDVVTVPVAFDGWPVELADTAGLRAAAGLEAEGIERAEAWIRDADLVVWVMDATVPAAEVVRPRPRVGPAVVNKTDQPAAWDLDAEPDALRVSALTGEGVPGLVAAIAQALVPHAPPPGAAVPYTPALADAVEAADAVDRLRAAIHGN
ncbi:MAG: 50S ribosome-binding GTPase [Gemmataceae bacterium]|nr:50S ribosome-binding GTPase [Gemmataceae bacterium]